MKVIEIDQTIEACLATALDAALKQGGLAMKANVDKILTSIKEVENKNG